MWPERTRHGLIRCKSSRASPSCCQTPCHGNGLRQRSGATARGCHQTSAWGPRRFRASEAVARRENKRHDRYALPTKCQECTQKLHHGITGKLSVESTNARGWLQLGRGRDWSPSLVENSQSSVSNGRFQLFAREPGIGFTIHFPFFPH